MPTDNGQLAAIAFRQVKQCHSDLRKLFRGLDDEMRKTGWVRLWGGRDAVTLEVSKSIDAEHWMPSKAYRLYKHPELPNDVEGIVAVFFSDDRAVTEPLFVAGRGRYNLPEGKKISSDKVVHPWDFVKAFLRLNQGEEINPNRVLHEVSPEAGPIAEMWVVGADLYSIRTIDDVKALLDKVRPSSATTRAAGEAEIRNPEATTRATGENEEAEASTVETSTLATGESE